MVYARLVIMPDILTKLLHCLPPEVAHDVAVTGLKYGFIPATSKCYPKLTQTLWGKEFVNPVGLAAGFDKNGEVLGALFKLGFGFIEAGTVTLHPRKGNPKPRLFRLPEQQAVVNRMGLNNVGVERFMRNVQNYKGHQPVGVNFGAYEPLELPQLVEKLSALTQQASYFVLNISCPNVEGGRENQFSDTLRANLVGIRNGLGEGVLLLVKLSPDLTDVQLQKIIAISMEYNVNGFVLTNTLPNTHSKEAGGLSGKPLRDKSTQTVRTVYKLTKGALPIIGVGGIFTVEDAYEKIKAGASLVQIYTGFIYQGAGVIQQINEGLVTLLEKDGYAHISEAVGTANS